MILLDIFNMRKKKYSSSLIGDEKSFFLEYFILHNSRQRMEEVSFFNGYVCYYGRQKYNACTNKKNVVIQCNTSKIYWIKFRFIIIIIIIILNSTVD